MSGAADRSAARRLRRVRRVHFVGIGGAGMSGIAELLLDAGYAVSGSDLRAGAAVERLRGRGIPIELGHDASNVGEVDVVVYSTAVAAHNPELRAAEAAKVPVIPRAEMLAELMRMRDGVAVAGSHGKTTTTSMVGAVLQEGGLDPTTIVGGRVLSLGRHSRLGSGNTLVAEADESDGSFLRLWPNVVVVTNIDREHLDHYGSLEALERSFLEFANRVPFYGAAILCLDDVRIQALLPHVTRRAVTYGLSAQAEIQAHGIEPLGLATAFEVSVGEEDQGRVRLRVPGRHNVRNALAAIGVGLEFEVPFPVIRRALEGFSGVGRRFEVLGEPHGILVVDDYSHHPTEVRAALEAARSGLRRRIVLAYQPHRFTRTRDLFEELAGAFHDADCVLLTEIYPAGESKLPGIEGRALADAVRAHGHRNVQFVADAPDLLEAVEREAREGDLVIFMGAGDIGRRASEFVALLDPDSRGGS
ncbi:MAG: UDP-N-acetylmuramate--L-alanine ligase [Myxococcota bacterium]